MNEADSDKVLKHLTGDERAVWMSLDDDIKGDIAIYGDPVERQIYAKATAAHFSRMNQQVDIAAGQDPESTPLDGRIAALSQRDDTLSAWLSDLDARLTRMEQALLAHDSEHAGTLEFGATTRQEDAEPGLYGVSGGDNEEDPPWTTRVPSEEYANLKAVLGHARHLLECKGMRNFLCGELGLLTQTDRLQARHNADFLLAAIEDWNNSLPF